MINSGHVHTSSGQVLELSMVMSIIEMAMSIIDGHADNWLASFWSQVETRDLFSIGVRWQGEGR